MAAKKISILPYFTINVFLIYGQLFHLFPHSFYKFCLKTSGAETRADLRAVAPIAEVNEALIRSTKIKKKKGYTRLDHSRINQMQEYQAESETMQLCNNKLHYYALWAFTATNIS